MKRTIFIVWLMAFVTLSISGCIVVISDDEAGGVHWASEYDEVREQQNEARTQAAQAVLDDVRSGFDGDEFVREEPILIAAKDGVVTLSGEASSVEIVDRAVRIASATDGVDTVVSRVVVVVDD